MPRISALARSLLAVALASATALASTLVPSPSVQASPAAGTVVVDDRTGVQVYDYDLGATAFTVPGFHALTPRGMPSDRLAPLELTGRVYLPDEAAGAEPPLVVIAHGLFWTCDDDAAGTVAHVWPCRGDFQAIASDRGYDHLGHALAARGIAVISVGANGVNAGELGEVADRARAAVVFRHLRLWRDVVSDGAGRLAGAMTEAATGEPASPDLRGVADLEHVGLLGHSRGGRGVMWAAADAHRDLVPRDVTIRAVFGLAAAEPPFMDRRARRLVVSRMPLMTWAGTCDVTGGDEYNRLARRRGNPVNIGLTVHGANHNNLNARWAARSGLPGGEDDALHPPGRPGKCYAWDPAQLDDTLGYRAEQEVAATYVRAFFARYLLGDRSLDAVLTGERRPVRHLTRVGVRRY